MNEDILLRLQALISRGRLSFVDDSGVVQQVQVVMNAGDLPGHRYRLQEFGFTSNPPNDSDALVVHVAGDRSSGVVVGTNHQPSRPVNLQPGEMQIYSQDGKSIYLTASGGIVVEAKGQAVTVNDATTVTINAATGVVMNTPLLKVSGDILDNCNTNTDTVAGMRAIANGHTHPILLVQTGSSNIATQPPTQHE